MTLKTNRTVHARMDEDGIVVFELRDGTRRSRAGRVFGYATYSKIWLRIKRLNASKTITAVESFSTVREHITAWVGKNSAG